MRLTGQVVAPVELTPKQRERMFALMREHFDGVDPSQFEQDLAEKDWVVLLHARGTAELQGFSTLKILRAEIEQTPVVAFFSGDTIVHRDYWGEPELASVWGHFVLSLADTFRDEHVYWFLISKGYRTYKFLPVYFQRFYPACTEPTPDFEQAVLNGLASDKFGANFDPERGVVSFTGNKDRLRPDLAEVPTGRLSDPHIHFFLTRNPGYVNGDELVCLASLHPDNLKPIARRIVARASHRAPDASNRTISHQ